jgi:uncharacterized protein (DUF1015 family)
MDIVKPFTGIRPYSTSDLCTHYGLLSPESAANIDIGYSTDQKIKSVMTMLADKLLVKDSEPCFYIYRQTNPQFSSIGLIALVDLNSLGSRIRLHEFTLPAKETSYYNLFIEYAMQINPILLMHEQLSAIESQLHILTSTKASISFVYGQVLNELWVLNEAENIKTLAQLFNNIEILYLADGHHRITATANYAKYHKLDNSFCAAYIVSANNTRIYNYNRLISNFNGLNEQAFWMRLKQYFKVAPVSSIHNPLVREDLMLYVGGQWFSLFYRPCEDNEFDHSIKLKLLLADKCFFHKVLNIAEQRTSQILTYMPGNRELEILEQQVDSLKFKAALVIPPLTAENFFDVAQNQIVLPPNSTWFEPKLLDGMINYQFLGK